MLCTTRWQALTLHPLLIQLQEISLELHFTLVVHFIGYIGY